MSRVSGVDLVIGGKDESGPIFGAFERRLREMQGSVAATGQKMSQDLVGKVGKGLVGFFGLNAVDGALREFNEKIKAGANLTEAGIGAAESFAAGLKSFPIAGVVGEWLGDLFDPLFGGHLAQEKAIEAGRKAAEKAGEINAAIDAQIAKLREDTLTDEERRRKAFDADANKILAGTVGTGQLSATREKLQTEFAAREERIRNEQAAREAEALAATNRAYEDAIAKLRQDTLSEEERRRAEFEKSIEPLLARFEGGSRDAARSQLAEEFAAQEERRRAREAEERAQVEAAERERAIAVEQRAREQSETEAARERERQEEERIRRLDKIRRAEEQLSGAVDADQVSLRAMAFRNARASETQASPPASSEPSTATRLQAQAAESLNTIARATEASLAALRAILAKQPEYLRATA